MKWLKYACYLSVCLIGTLLCNPVEAEPLPYDIPPVNAFTAGIGGAAVAVTDNPAAIYWNPSCFGVTEMMEVDFSVAASKLESPGSWSFLIANSSTGGDGRFGMGIIRRHAIKNGEKFRSFQVIFPVAHQFGAGLFPIGVSVKFISENYDDSGWKYGMSFDAGAMLVLPTGFKVGYSAQNLVGGDLRAFRSKSWLGASWGGGDFPILVAGQIRAERLRRRTYTTDNFNIGLEISPLPELPELRGGWLRAEGEGRLTMGFSYKLGKENARLEYALVVDPDGWDETTHFVTYSWGLKPSGPAVGRMFGAR